MRRLVCLLGSVALLAGCGGGEIVPQSPSPRREVRVDFLGYESFLLTSAFGTKIVTNPFNSGAGGRSLPANLKPDVVLVSTEIPQANNVDFFDNSPTVFRGAVGIGTNTATGLRIRGIPCYRSLDAETVDGMNLIFVWSLEGIRFCFLGNIERPLTPAQLLQVGQADVVFMPAGVPIPLSDADRRALVSQLNPRLIIPMGRPNDLGGWAPSRVHRLPGSSVLLSRDSLPAEQTVLVFGTP